MADPRAPQSKKYRLGVTRRLINALVEPLTRVGLAGSHTYLLTVRGRKSGKAYSTPVRLIEGDQRWLVAPYGEVGWVRNARAVGEVTISRRGREEQMRIREVGADESAPVLKEYLRRVAVARPFFDATTESSLSAFASEASRHPVFELSSVD